MVAALIRLGIFARKNKLPAPRASFVTALRAVKNAKDDPPAPPVTEQVFYGRSHAHTFSLDKASPDYNARFAYFVEKDVKKGFERANEDDLANPYAVLLYQIYGYDPFPDHRPRRVGKLLDMSSQETRGLGEHPLKSRFDKARKALIVETEGLVTTLLTTGQAPGGNYYTPFCAEAASYYAQNNILTDADPFRDKTDDPGRDKSRTYAMNNIASLDDGLRLIKQAFASDPRPLTDIVIATHGSDGKMQFIDASGKAMLVKIENLDDFLLNLKTIGMIKPGGQLHLTGCSIAESKASQKALQELSTAYGLRIIANRTASTWRRPALSNAMVFYPGTDTETELVRKYYDYKNAAAGNP
jgi:hypothetical protein